MIKLGKLALDGSPRVAVSFTDADDDANIRLAIQGGVDIAELRIDQFASLNQNHVVANARRFAALPTIATIRHQAEAGGWTGSEDQRIALYRALLPVVDGIDVELQFGETIVALLPEVRAQGKLLIASHHDFQATPVLDEIRDIIRRGKAIGADIVKVAAQVHSQRDVRTLARTLVESETMNLIVIGMGPKGLLTRTLFPGLGSLLTFAANGPRQSAPGQLPYDQMRNLFRQLYQGRPNQG